MEANSSPTVGYDEEEEEEDDLTDAPEKSRERPPIVGEEDADEDLGFRSRSQETLIW